MIFETSYEKILEQIAAIDPPAYGKTRNHGDGAVTKLSPYISRGVISTKQVYEAILARGFQFGEMVKLIQELAWRDYWQQVWIAKGDEINSDLRHEQPKVKNHEIAINLLNATTGIEAVDDGIKALYETGYMHNHMRMYVASIACNIGKSHWHIPAKWMYYHLLDADWASNALSWQWVAGANSNKKYYANQENINTFFKTNQTGTFLDVAYDQFDEMQIPVALKETVTPTLKTILPDTPKPTIDVNLPTLVYTVYNLDPLWKKEIPANRILLLEPDHFLSYPMCNATMDFILKLSKNIGDIQIWVGSFSDLKAKCNSSTLFYKEHPLSRHFIGVEEPRDWMFDVTGYFRSFFAFWKKCQKKIPFV